MRVPESRDKLPQRMDAAEEFTASLSGSAGDGYPSICSDGGNWVQRTVARARGGRGNNGSGFLPSWYPRVPLQDITAVVGAYERSALRGDRDGRVDDSVTRGSSSPDGAASASALLEHDLSMLMDPGSSVRKAVYCPSAGKSLRGDQVREKLLDGNSDCITPQRELLNDIDSVQDLVLGEIRKFNRTPVAKKAKRDRKVRILMSMR